VCAADAYGGDSDNDDNNNDHHDDDERCDCGASLVTTRTATTAHVVEVADMNRCNHNYDDCQCMQSTDGART